MNMSKIIQYFVIISLLFPACGSPESPEEVTDTSARPGEVIVTVSQFNANQMEVDHPLTRRFSNTVRASGTIDVPPQNRAQITAIMGGFVKSIPLLVGNEVRRGQLLVVLENPDYVGLQQEYLEVSESMSYLSAEFERQQKLYEEKITSQKNFLKAQSDYKQASARLAGLRANLNMLGIPVSEVEKGNFTSQVTIRSPLTGTVTALNVSLGSYVRESDLIMEVVDPSHKHLELKVYEKDILNLSEDQVVRFSVPEASDESYEAGIQLIGRSVDASSRTVQVHGHLREEDEDRFTVGMFVEAEIILDNEEILSVPESALVGSGENAHILILKESSDDTYTFTRFPVDVEDLQEGYIPLKDLSDTSIQVLVKGTFGLSRSGE